MVILVKHVHSNDSWNIPKDGSNSWLDYWNNNSLYSMPRTCPDCGKILNYSNAVGAHVKKVNSSDNDIYIIPVCKSCNTRAATDCHSFYCDERLLVKANKNKL